MRKKKILHITNDYAGSTVYKNLIRELDRMGVPQIVYTPVKSAKSIGRNEIKLKTKGSKIIYSYILNKSFDRLFYRLKIKKIFRDIQKEVDLSDIGFIHAHTWYSDGGVAQMIFKEYKISYIISIRNTDINVFQKYLIHERRFGQSILKDAKKIILISASYVHRILSLSSLNEVKSDIQFKMRLIPNGVAPFWIENSREIGLEKKNTFNILYIGNFRRLKNVVNLQKAALSLHDNCSNEVVLHIVGYGGNDTKKVLSLVKRFPTVLKYYGEIYDKTKLLNRLREADIFAMPSKHETFGLVYVEAMLQGLPILYTKGEGIDGLYGEKIGEKVQGFSSMEIRKKLERLISHYEEYEIPLKELKKKHDWSIIAKEYVEIYQISSMKEKYKLKRG